LLKKFDRFEIKLYWPIVRYVVLVTIRITRLQTRPEYEQWSQDLVKTWCQAKRVMKKGPKLISTQRSVAGDANYNKVLNKLIVKYRLGFLAKCRHLCFS